MATLRDAVYGAAVGDDEDWAFMAALLDRPRDEVRSGGYVLDTFSDALWSLAGTDSYRGAIVRAVELGDDTDTTACVTGALAGIVYGCQGIPAEWLSALRGKDIIESCLF